MSIFGVSIRNGVPIGLGAIISFSRQASTSPPPPPVEPPQAVFSEASNSQYVPLLF